MQLLGIDLSLDLIITFASFWIILLLTLSTIKRSFKTNKTFDWIINVFGLLNQGLLVPLIIIFLFVPVFKNLLPVSLQNIEIPLWAVFLIPLTLVDYLYYWNHRLLHSVRFWPVHRLHHSAQNIELFVTSRNSLVTPFFILYLWIHPLFLVLFNGNEAYLLGVAVSSSLDLWRHSGLKTPSPFKFFEILLITPEQHSLHHTDSTRMVNLGANLNIWDKLHGTFLKPNNSSTASFGENLTEKQLQKIFLRPWSFKA